MPRDRSAAARGDDDVLPADRLAPVRHHEAAVNVQAHGGMPAPDIDAWAEQLDLALAAIRG